MWTKINQVFTSRDGQNGWAHLVGTNAWHKILPGSADGVTNVFTLLTTAKGNDRQVFVVFDATAQKNITQSYM
ncbi:MAG TPA: hypothetical protein VJV03_06180 [Pyrinomonadaceae bacterium]|nr:hypothetical protein [Pyrinomonadaceae bacterium]